MPDNTMSAAEAAHGRSRASKALSNARQRCTNANNKDYAAYGAMGIQVLITQNELIEAIGLPPKNASLDRIDPSGHYEAGNVRWATKSVQAANKKSSIAGGTLPLKSLIAQAKQLVAQDKLRPKVTEAWDQILEAYNYGKLSLSDAAVLAENLGIIGPANEWFKSKEVLVGGDPYASFLLPSLTRPKGFVTARGGAKPAPEKELARRYVRHGLLYRLSRVEGSINVPKALHSSIDDLIKGDSLGLTLIGRPAEEDLEGGWFEAWMLAAASRLHLTHHFSTAMYPALTCLDLLGEFGGQNSWDQTSHPVLDADLLFIPDFQLDCGSWGYLSPYQFGALERLLRYRIEMDHKTVVGVQAPLKLSLGLQKTLMAEFSVLPISKGTAPQSWD